MGYEQCAADEWKNDPMSYFELTYNDSVSAKEIINFNCEIENHFPRRSSCGLKSGNCSSVYTSQNLFFTKNILYAK